MIINFSSPHSFEFITGEVLPARDEDWVKKMSLDITEAESKREETLSGQNKSWTDIELTIKIPEKVKAVIDQLRDDNRIDIVLVPFMMLQAMKDANLNIDKFRTIRVADRISKKIYSDRFCK